jgi:hypothetical protein
LDEDGASWLDESSIPVKRMILPDDIQMGLPLILPKESANKSRLCLRNLHPEAVVSIVLYCTQTSAWSEPELHHNVQMFLVLL